MGAFNRWKGYYIIIHIIIMVIIMFVDRHIELKALRRRLTSDEFELIVIYGRRRVGKTRLLSELHQ